MKRQLISPSYLQISTNQQKHHRKITSAKSRNFSVQKGYVLPQSRVDPMKVYQYNTNNLKLVHKLIQIYDEKPKGIIIEKKLKKRNNKNISGTMVSNFMRRQEEEEIYRININLFKRINSAKPSMGNWSQRQNLLNKFSQLTRRKVSTDIGLKKLQNNQFMNFRNYIYRKTKSKRHKKAKSSVFQQKKNNSQQNSVSEHNQPLINDLR